ncbi:hypothetical protein FGE12_06885 [Aggregicoccus sp. 17bor-14]|uniref:hypothetical protein n=1 Tax=Myxococcaceae TaxID=31 RepID=UPI00129CCD90|nr:MULTISPECIES: hypothetical protein [Myxococcaceae]MBF5042114.1 hypothetical protein [Simulacricoccus sp. 17bor-14]MRI87891.1 hypothetical protein [Aggregicoccus sp. 17bor-14]
MTQHTLSDAHRRALLQAIAEAHARVEQAYPEGASPALSQGWVDRRRVLLVDLALHLAEEAVRGEALEVRTLVEKLYQVLEVARVLAPGHHVDRAADAVLEGLSEGAPEGELD